jgi:short subunit dehydrogenase-like uncharacterized protein
MRLILYGSYGYTGNLIAEKLSGLNLDVLLSGRNASKLKEQSETLNLPFQKASLDSENELDMLLNAGDTVLHCAGPFIDTWEPMANACLRNGCHYLDITGEIQVFESLHALDNKFRNENLMAMPGTGFDVVPTDCMASYLNEKLPGASGLELAFAGLGSGVSRGTLKTMIGNLGKGGAIRLNGRIENVKSAWRCKNIDFGFGTNEKMAVTIPWGDISTAFYSTGIKNITVFMAMPRKQINMLRLSEYLKPLLRTVAAKSVFNHFAERGKPGPDKNERHNGKSMVWGEVSNDYGETKSAVLQTMEGYRLTSESAVLISRKVLKGDFKPGFQTPSLAYGPDLILELDETVRIDRV